MIDFDCNSNNVRSKKRFNNLVPICETGRDRWEEYKRFGTLPKGLEKDFLELNPFFLRLTKPLLVEENSVWSVIKLDSKLNSVKAITVNDKKSMILVVTDTTGTLHKIHWNASGLGRQYYSRQSSKNYTFS